MGHQGVERWLSNNLKECFLEQVSWELIWMWIVGVGEDTLDAVNSVSPGPRGRGKVNRLEKTGKESEDLQI